MASERTMLVAEALYNRGIISYPRTETDFFQDGFELVGILEQQRGHSLWGPVSSDIIDRGLFEWPKPGGHDDQGAIPSSLAYLSSLSNEPTTSPSPDPPDQVRGAGRPRE